MEQNTDTNDDAIARQSSILKLALEFFIWNGLKLGVVILFILFLFNGVAFSVRWTFDDFMSKGTLALILGLIGGAIWFIIESIMRRKKSIRNNQSPVA